MRKVPDRLIAAGTYLKVGRRDEDNLGPERAKDHLGKDSQGWPIQMFDAMKA